MHVLHVSTGGAWTVLSEEVTDSCYVVKDLPRGTSYVFRVGCVTKTGTGPFSDASAPVVMATYPEGKRNAAVGRGFLLHVFLTGVIFCCPHGTYETCYVV